MSIGPVKQGIESIVKPRRFCFFADPLSSEPGSAESNESAPEQPLSCGIPIDVNPLTDAPDPQKTFAEDQAFMNQYGGTTVDMNKVEGLGGSGYESPLHINIPPDLDKYDKPPRILFYAHGNGEQALKQTKYMMEQVEKMRKNGDPVIVVRPQDFNIKKGPDGKYKNWGDMDNPNAFEDMIKVAEKLAGRPVAKNITMAAFSGGGKAVQKAVGNLQQKAANGDKKAEEMYKRIKKVAFLDAYCQETEEIKKWQQGSPDRILHYNTWQTHKSHGNAMLDFQKFADRKGIGEETTEAPTDANAQMRIPERQEEAMTGTQFTEALKNCKTNQERQQLILQQAALGAFSPNFRKVKEYKTTVDGQEVTVRMQGPVEFGTADDKVRVSIDGPTSKALADMLGGNLTTAQLQQKLADDPRVAKLPMYNGNDVAKRINAERAKNGLPPVQYAIKKSNGKVVPNGTLMRSPEFMAMQSKMIEEYMRANNISPEQLTFGSRKVVVISDSPSRLEGDKLDIFGGLKRGANGKVTSEIIQPAYSPHEAEYYDYSQSTEIIGANIKVGDQEVPFRKIMTDPKYENIRKALFSANAIDPDKAYKYPQWMQNAVKEYRKNNNLSPMQIAQPTPTGNEATSTAPPPSGGIPIAGGGGGSGGGSGSGSGSYRTGGGEAPSAPSSPSEPTTPPTSESTAETGESKETVPIKGSAMFFGDSISVNIHNSKELKFEGPTSTIAEPSKTTNWILQQISPLAETGSKLNSNQERTKKTIENTENAVILIGANDIGSRYSADEIFGRIEQIWNTLKKINPNIKINAVTIPPFKGWPGYSNNFDKINEKRIAINNKIKGSQIPDRIIDLCKKASEGGVADETDENKQHPDYSRDHLHINQDKLGAIYQKELSKPERKKTP